VRFYFSELLNEQSDDLFVNLLLLQAFSKELGHWSSVLRALRGTAVRIARALRPQTVDGRRLRRSDLRAVLARRLLRVAFLAERGSRRRSVHRNRTRGVSILARAESRDELRVVAQKGALRVDGDDDLDAVVSGIVR
jgi:hypothetical protein